MVGQVWPPGGRLWMNGHLVLSVGPQLAKVGVSSVPTRGRADYARWGPSTIGGIHTDEVPGSHATGVGVVSAARVQDKNLHVSPENRKPRQKVSVTWQS